MMIITLMSMISLTYCLGLYLEVLFSFYGTLSSNINEMHINHTGDNKNAMNRSQIQLIVQISETGSFTKAGEELHMTHSRL
ncbi:hypothetical protein BsIDN1_32350 [Bacillus safensis]|uniref:HTH lysR-type domain-containing protein n=1 Tax=Bacillus safensis TaxID=561879 RepID=A0A5S9M7Z5_BACIA|nr:hypothetical protein BsIDN1_32350 [Bacillus safensis]